MFLVLYKDKSISFDNTLDLIKYIEDNNIHPDTVQIYEGDFKELGYINILKEDFFTKKTVELAGHEARGIRSWIIQNLKKEGYENFNVFVHVHPYGSFVHFCKLQVGFNPVCEITITFKNKTDVSTQKLRHVVKKSLENDWQLVKVQSGGQEFLLSKTWKSFKVFIYKDRDKFSKND